MEFITLIPALQAILATSWRLSTPMIYAAMGEIFSEKSGVLNIGLEGCMLIGAFMGFIGGFYTGSAILGLIIALLSGLLVGLLFAFFTITLQVNQVLVGIALNLIGLGMTSFFFRSQFADIVRGVETFKPIPIPFLSDIPFLGEILFKHNFLVYGTIILVPIIAFIFHKTGFGLAIRSVGEHPRAADTMGINVALIRYICVMIGTTLAALGGASMTLAHLDRFVEGMTNGRGFIAMAIVVFGGWSPKGVFATSLLFGFFFSLQLRLQAIANISIPYQFLQAMPYVMSLIVLASAHGKAVTPKALGEPYQK